MADYATALERVQLTALMGRSEGRPEFNIGLIDGPVARRHSELDGANVREVKGGPPGLCTQPSSGACIHGTFVASVLCGNRSGTKPAIAARCTLLSRPIFSEEDNGSGAMPSATPGELAAAVVDTVDAGARIMNISAASGRAASHSERALDEALDYAAQSGVLVIAAAGNQASIGSSPITRHHWVLPVAACDVSGRPLASSNLGKSIAIRGLAAPGENVQSLGADGRPHVFGGTSAAAPFVTGALALIWSEFPRASAAEVKMAIARAHQGRRTTIVPPVLDAWAIYRALA